MKKALGLLMIVFCTVTANLRAQTLVEQLTPYIKSHTIAGAVTVIANSNSILRLDTVGFADISNNCPMKPDTLFWIASQSKPITAAALMMLVDEGKIHLDDPVSLYIPQFKDPWVIQEATTNRMTLTQAKTPITIRHLLSHTSGLPFSSKIEVQPYDTLPLRDAVYTYALTPLGSEPGTKHLYANAGINTCGRIIEIVSGMPYETFLQTRLFDPLGMKDTTFWPTPEQEARLAKSYQAGPALTNLVECPIFQLTYPLHDRTIRFPMPAGGLFSTAADITRFCQMLLNKGTFEGRRFLSEESVREMSTKQTGDLPNNYGLGLTVNPHGFGHGGAYSTDMAVDRDTGMITVYLIQHYKKPENGSQKALDTFRAFARNHFTELNK